MQSTATNVDAYLTEAPTDRQDVLQAIRQLCLDNLSGFDESMQYGMPSYARDGEVKFAFASQKQYLSLYGLNQDGLVSYRKLFSGAKLGKSCIRYTNPEKVDLDAVARLLQAIRGCWGVGVIGRTRNGRRIPVTP